ncbi:MAG: glycoside hydrolase family 2 protein [Candidatus Helarchaeota archaeon]
MKELNLNGYWSYRHASLNEGIKNKWFQISFIKKNSKNKVKLPNCWNYIKENGQYPYLEYEGVMWFFRDFIHEEIKKEHDYFLHFKGANYLTNVWLNASYLGKHEGGFLPFKFKINDVLKNGINFLAVRVENLRKSDRIPCEGFDWYNYGGIYRDVFVENVNKIRFGKFKIKTDKLLRNKAIIEINFEQTQNFNFSWEIYLNDHLVSKGAYQKGEKKDKLKISINQPKLWSPNNPTLYSIRIENEITKKVTEFKFGIRIVELRTGKLFINKRKIYLNGVSLHEELVPHGRAIPISERRKDIISMKRLGFNALRTAHYSHDESLIELADELGIFILEEIPIYWSIDFANPKIFKLGIKMINALIERDYNHPSVIMWSLGNEIPAENKYCRHVMRHLYLFARRKDDSRIITHVSNRLWGDFLRKNADIICLNLYLGWYLLSEKHLNFILEMIKDSEKKPFFITEFGAGAKFGFHSNELERFSEEKQASILSHSIKTFNSKNWIQGHFIWIYRDFKSPLRTNKYQQGFNRKGIVSEKNEKKIIARAYNAVKKKKFRLRRFRFLSIFIGFAMKWIEGFLYDVILSMIAKKVINFQYNKFYKREKKKNF